MSEPIAKKIEMTRGDSCWTAQVITADGAVVCATTRSTAKSAFDDALRDAEIPRSKVKRVRTRVDPVATGKIYYAISSGRRRRHK